MARQPGNPTNSSTTVSDADRAGQVQPWTPQTSVRQTAAALRPPQGMTLSRLPFYGGAIALGGLGVVDASPSSAAESSASPPDSAALPR